MEVALFQEVIDFSLGFFPSAPEYGRIVPSSTYDALNAWCRSGRWESDRGTSGAGSTGGVSDLQIIRGQLAGVSGIGNIWSAFGTEWFVGSSAFVGGSSIGSSPGVLSLLVSGSPVPAGLAKPNAPTFAASATSGTLTGSYAVAVAAFRQTTGAVSSVSNLSNAISVNAKKGVITFPSAPSGATHWLVYGTRRGFGSIGPAFRITTIAIVTVATPTLTLDWVDGYLGDIGGDNFDPPPACTHVCAIGGSVGALGTGSGGYGCRFSLVAKPEAFPPEFHFDLPVRESITGVQPGVDGVVLVSTANGLMSLVATGDELTPVLPRVIFGNVGFARQNAWTVVFDQIYGFSGKRGAIRTQGESNPDSSFAAPVRKYFADNGFTASNTVVYYDQSNDAVIYASGTKAVPFMLGDSVWSAPITLPGTATAGIAQGSRGVVQVGSGGLILDAGGGSPSGGWFLRSPYYALSESHPHNQKVIEEVWINGEGNATVDLWDGLTRATIGGMFPNSFTTPYNSTATRVLCPNKAVRSLVFRASGSGGGETPPNVVVNGYTEPLAA